jgi:hypothetical protein
VQRYRASHGLANIASGKTQAGGTSSGLQVFPKDHIWNTPIDTMPVRADSSSLLDPANVGTDPLGLKWELERLKPFRLRLERACLPLQWIHALLVGGCGGSADLSWAAQV